LKRLKTMGRRRRIGCMIKIRVEVAGGNEVVGSGGVVRVGRLQNRDVVVAVMVVLRLRVVEGICCRNSTVYQLGLHHCKLRLERCHLRIYIFCHNSFHFGPIPNLFFPKFITKLGLGNF
ncbi:hypothetical protein U1Q18_049912, partial [Sarracenia purpurea var. burkii]